MDEVSRAMLKVSFILTICLELPYGNRCYHSAIALLKGLVVWLAGSFAIVSSVYHLKAKFQTFKLLCVRI